MIYLDNAATTLQKPREVTDAVIEAMGSMGNAARGTSSGSMKASRTVYETRVRIAELLGCPKADHVVFTSNSTEALNIAICGTISPGDHVIATDLEHNSVLRPLYRLEKERKVSLSFVSADRSGNVSYDEFDTLIRPETKAIVCTHASNLTGTVLDIRRIGAVARKHGLLFIIDVSQTAGCLSVDMTRYGADILCFTGHKGLMGPQGTGGLCIRPGVEIRPFKVGGTGIHSYSKEQPADYPTRLEAGTLNSHGIAGLSAAVEYIRRIGIETIAAKENALMRRFYEGVSSLDGVTVYGDFSTSERTAIVALNVRDYDSGAVSDELSEKYDIATRPGAHCAPRLHEALGTKAQGAVRFSFSWFNTEAEIDAAIRAVKEISA